MTERVRLHVVALSGGKDSTALALRLRELHPDREYTYICTPTGDELPEMREHWRELELRLGAPIFEIAHERTLVQEIIKKGMLPNWRARWCTRTLKIEPCQRWISRRAKTHRVILYVGLRADEEGREGGIYDDCEVEFPMREWGWGLADVWRYLFSQSVTIPTRTDCARCFFQRPAEWWDLWREHPDLYASAVEDEKFTGHTYISPTKGGRWAVSLTEMRARFEAGEIPANADANRDLFEDAVDFRANQCRVCSL